MKDSKRILGIHDEHLDAIRQLEADAAASGRRLTEEDQAYINELRAEGSAILAAADRASKQETGRIDRPDHVVVADTSGNLSIDRPPELPSDDKLPVAGGGRLA